MKTILLKFAGPLQSWGTSSRFETRSTDRYPSKSAVIGMIAASFGYLRDEMCIKDLNQLDFAVRVDQPGELLSDYQQSNNKKNWKKMVQLERVYVTERQYLQDAIFVVALGSSEQNWMVEIEYALKHPYFQPYLGRRCNPLTRDFLSAVEVKM